MYQQVGAAEAHLRNSQSFLFQQQQQQQMHQQQQQHNQQQQQHNQQNNFGQFTAFFNPNKQHSYSGLNDKSNTMPRKYQHNQESTSNANNSKMKNDHSKKKSTHKIQTKNSEKPTASNNNNSSNSNLTVQVYNLKQNLTKQMLHDLLEPYVSTIDFKKKLETNGNDVTDGNNTTINEDQVEVFIKFKNLDKLNEALKSFNLKELDLLMSNFDVEATAVASSEIKGDGSDDFRGNNNNNNLTTNQLTNQSPFLFRPLTIF